MRHGSHAKQSLMVTSTSAIEHILKHRPDRFSLLRFSGDRKQLSDRLGVLHALAHEHRIPVELGAAHRMGESAVTGYLHPFIYTEVRDLIRKTENQSMATVLALDHIQDPQNLGALCRTAEYLGATGILLPKNRGVSVSSGAYNASVGAIETVPICMVSNLGDGLKWFKEAGFWVAGTSLDRQAVAPWEMPDFEKVIFVLGAEGSGVGNKISELCDINLKIPLAGEVASLNVSVAGSLLLYEQFRRKGIRSLSASSHQN